MDATYEPGGYCPGCGYRIDPGYCPECGADVGAERLLRSRPGGRLRRLLKGAAVLGLVIGAGFGLWHGMVWAVPKITPTSTLISLHDVDGWLGQYASALLRERLIRGQVTEEQIKRLIRPMMPFRGESKQEVVVDSAGFRLLVECDLGQVCRSSYYTLRSLNVGGERVVAPMVVHQSRSICRNARRRLVTIELGPLPISKEVYDLEVDLHVLTAGYIVARYTSRVRLGFEKASADLDELAAGRGPGRVTLEVLPGTGREDTLWLPPRPIPVPIPCR